MEQDKLGNQGRNEQVFKLQPTAITDILKILIYCPLLSGCIAGTDPAKEPALVEEKILQVDWVATAPTPLPHHPMDFFRDIGFADITTGYAVGMNTIFYKTVDGGATWTLTPVPANLYWRSDQAIHSIHFESANMGFLSGFKANQGYIAKSTDMGQTWTIKTPFMTEYAEVIEFNGNVGLAAGNGGFLIRSNDYGETWMKITSVPPTESFSRIYMDERSRFYLGGLHGVYVSTDLGLTWSVTPSEGPLSSDRMYLGSLHMQSATIGYSFNGSILVKTTDGAITWNPIWKSAPGDGYFGGTLMVPEPDVLCFSITGKDKFYISRDGGATYERYTIPTGQVALAPQRVIWPKFAANGNYLYVFTNTASGAEGRPIFRIKYKGL